MSSRRKILITGTTGMLGSELVRTFYGKDQFEVYGLTRTSSALLPQHHQLSIDLAKPFPYKKLHFQPDVIIHTAAITDLNVCETNHDLATQVHVHASESLARLSGKNTLFFYISTDSVFDGEKGSYDETDLPNPLNYYAATKLRGERAVASENSGATIIIRTNIYGLHTPLRSSLAEWAYSQWKQGKSISGFSDIFFNPVFTQQLAAVLETLISREIIFPIINVGSDQAINKYAFLSKLKDALKVKNTDLLRPGKSADFPSRIQRPKNTSLNTSLLETFFEVPTVESGLSQWLARAHQAGLTI